MNTEKLSDASKKLLEAIQGGPAEVSKVLLTLSNRAICEVILENDWYASASLKPSDIRPNQLLFEQIVSAAFLPEVKDRMILAKYVVYHVTEVIKIRRGGTNKVGLLPMSPLIMEKISPEECANIVKTLDPANFKPELRVTMRYAFEQFIDLVMSKESFSPAKRWRDIKREVLYSIARSLSNRVEGHRFFTDCDEKTIQKFNTHSASKRIGGGTDLRLENRMRKIVRELMDGKGLKYTPLCKSQDAYMEFSTEERIGAFVFPLGEPVTVELINPLALVITGEALSTYQFSIESYVDILVEKRFDHKTLFKEERKRVRSHDGVVRFEVIFDSKISEPCIAEVTIRSFSTNGDPYLNITEKIIVLPEGETILEVNDRSFASVIYEFVSAGKISERDAEVALSNIGGADFSDSGIDIFSIFD